MEEKSVLVLRLTGDIEPDDADVFDDMETLLDYAKTRITNRHEVAMEFDDYDEKAWDEEGLLKRLEWDREVVLPDGATLTIDEGYYYQSKNK